jgi:putative chitinase
MKFFAIDNIEAIDFSKLMRQLPGRSTWNPFSTQGAYIQAILESQEMLRAHGIDTALRLAHFLGQGVVETGFLKYKSENLIYSAEVLKKLFGHKFRSDEEIAAYARKPEKIANRIYADRMGNGPEASGDGYRYRGRGFFQLTGKDNYKLYGDMAGIDLVADPEVLERDLKQSLQVAAAFFQKTGLIAFADQNDVPAVSRGINRGNPRSTKPAFHEAERIEWTTKALALVRDPASLLAGPNAAPAATPVAATDGPVKLGATGEAVARVQRMLDALGYAVGTADGVFGPGTRRAVLAFQEEHGLPITGEVDAATLTAMKAARDDKPAAPAGAETAPAPLPTPPVGKTTAPPGAKPPKAPTSKPPLAKSRTIWGAIIAAIAGIVEFARAGSAQVAALFPVVETPWGPFNTIWALAALLVIGIGLVIYARIDDRVRKGR